MTQSFHTKLWLHVPSDIYSRILAIQALVRPHEVASLVRPRYPWEQLPPLADQLGSYLRERAKQWQIRYLPDLGYKDIWQSPAFTLWRGVGDCEDLSILAASILKQAGVKVSVYVGEVLVNDTWSGHAWVEGEDEAGPFLLEATNGEVFRHYRPIEYRNAVNLGS